MKKKSLAALASALLSSCAVVPADVVKSARTAEICAGWPEQARDPLLTLQEGINDVRSRLQLGDDTAAVVDTFMVVNVTVTADGHCGLTSVAAEQRVWYPADFDRPHTMSVWQDGPVTHVRVLMYLGRGKKGEYLFYSLVGDLATSPA